jgi:hypothetical protein
MYNKIMIVASAVLASLVISMGQMAYADSNSLYIPQWERGYVEAWSKLPMSSHTANYTDGYTNGVNDSRTWGKTVHLGSLPAYTNDNYNRFYSGFHHGVAAGDQVYNDQGNETWIFRNSHGDVICPPRHTNEYCMGFNFGFNSAMFANDPPSIPTDTTNSLYLIHVPALPSLDEPT